MHINFCRRELGEQTELGPWLAVAPELPILSAYTLGHGVLHRVCIPLLLAALAAVLLLGQAVMSRLAGECHPPTENHQYQALKPAESKSLQPPDRDPPSRRATI